LTSAPRSTKLPREVEPKSDTPERAAPPHRPAAGNRARFIAAGILLSRAAGLLRDKVVAFYFAASPHGDVWTAALRLPNVLQNLLGDQAIAASFIPVYSRLLAAGRRRDAARFASAVCGLLVAVVAALVVLGMVLAPLLVAVFSAGFLRDASLVAAGQATYDRYPLAVKAARLIFPMTGLLVLAAWAQGVLASHRRFFLSYVAPVLWNASIVAALVLAAGGRRPAASGAETLDRWLLAAATGALVGGLLQLVVQLPLVLRVSGGLRPTLDRRAPGLRRAWRAFLPALLGRGVVQLSLYVDLQLASWLGAGAIAAIGFAGRLYALPISVFAMSVAASELPELARAGGGGEAGAAAIAARVARALRQAAFVICPAVVGFLAFGHPIVGFFRGGAFTAADQLLVYLVLAGYALGLLASTTSRLLQNTFFALGDTRTPARAAGLRLLVSAAASLLLMLPLNRLGIDLLLPSASKPLTLGALGLAAGASIAAWAELFWLRRALTRVLPDLRLPLAAVGRWLGLAVVLALPSLVLWWGVRAAGPAFVLALVPTSYAAVYLGFARWRRAPELELWLGRRGGGGG